MPLFRRPFATPLLAPALLAALVLGSAPATAGPRSEGGLWDNIRTLFRQQKMPVEEGDPAPSTPDASAGRNAGTNITTIHSVLKDGNKIVDESRSGRGLLVVPKITGIGMLKKEQILDAIGLPPSEPLHQRRWLKDASRRIVDLYLDSGYTRARAWGKIHDNGQIHFDVDEGRIQLVFVGAGTFAAFLYRIDMLPPNRIYHQPTVLKNLAELKRKYGMSTVYHRVQMVNPPVKNALGQPVNQQELRVYIINKEFFGWSPRITLSSTWGIVPAVGYSARDAIFEDDRFSADVAVAMPYRHFLYEDQPDIQWVHGRAHATFRFPKIGGGALAPQIETATAVSRFTRSGHDVESYLGQNSVGMASVLVQLPSEVQIKIGGGFDHSWAFDLGWASTVENKVTDLERTHFTALFEVTQSFDRRVMRLDHRDWTKLSLKVSTRGPNDTLVDFRFSGQFVINFHGHDLILRARGVALSGDLRFWDEANLSGDYLRCHFNSRYWIHEALQGSVGFRYAISRVFKVGAFHDFSGFFDLTEPGDPLAAATAFGPSLHFLLFDLFALDVYYAFGFAPVGFSHNLSFSLVRAF